MQYMMHKVDSFVAIQIMNWSIYESNRWGGKKVFAVAVIVGRSSSINILSS